MDNTAIKIQNESPVSKEVVHVTGKVLPVGNGAVGKTSLAKMLLAYTPGKTDYLDTIQAIRRTNNLEFEFMVSKIDQGNTQFSVVSQLLIPPGQKVYECTDLGRGVGAPRSPRRGCCARGLAQYRGPPLTEPLREPRAPIFTPLPQPNMTVATPRVRISGKTQLTRRPRDGRDCGRTVASE